MALLVSRRESPASSPLGAGQQASHSGTPETASIAEPADLAASDPQLPQLAATDSSQSPEAVAKPAVPREQDIALNPYAASLREPGKSKRAWDADYITSFRNAKTGDPVRFELTDGVIAQGRVEIIQFNGGLVSYVSGELTAPETGKFFFLTPPEGGKAGKAVGVVEFPGSKTAYRVEPTGTNGDPELWKRRLDEVVCMSMAEVDPECACGEAHAEIVPLRPDQVPDHVPSYNAEIVSLQSYPGSQAVLLLDFAGGYTSSWGGKTYARPNIGNDTIKDIWKRVAEDFMPFNINVTTDIKVFQAAPAASRQRCCFTPTPITAAGVAYIGSWNWGNDTVCWSVYYVGKSAAEVASHEVGHTLGLAHQGQTGGGEYYGGHGGGETGWGPIMGVGYYQPLTTWAKGEYVNANQPQDELQAIVGNNNNVDYRNDDTGATLASSRYLDVDASNNVSAEGVIERTGDTDAFQFTTTGGAVTLTVNPVAPGDWANLATKATLTDASDNVIATHDAQDDVSSTITTTLGAGTYSFRVTGTGKNDPVTNGFSDYASLGYYSITGNVAGARKPTRLIVADRAPNNTVVGSVPANNPNGSPLVYSITGGNTGGTFSVSNTGVVSVANNALLEYYALAANPSLYAARFEVFMTMTNVNNASLTETSRRVLIDVQQLYPPAPAGFSATLSSSLRVDLSWTESYGATAYKLKRSTTKGGPYTTIATLSSGSYIDSGLVHGVTYYYVVAAVNANGESLTSPEASVLASSVAGGFESPVISGYSYNPAGGGGGWTFGGTTGDGSGLVSNGSGFNNPTAPEGVQAAFLQSHGSITQTFSGFTPGSLYTISYLAAQRPGNEQTWDVVLDGNVISSHTAGSNSYAAYTATFTATAAYHTLAFVGTNAAGGDNTVFIDNVQIGIAGPTTPNFSFETPSLGGGGGAYSYNPSGGSWAFSGSPGNGSGIAANGSAFNPPNAPHGTQVAFVQSLGTITQTFSGFTPGKAYTLTYLAAQRPNPYGGETWNVKIDNTVIQSNTIPGSNSFTSFTANFTATAASHTLAFAGTNLTGGDRSIFIDRVSISQRDSLQPLLPAVALTSPANNAAFLPHAPVGFTASVTANGNLVNGVQFFVDNVAIGQSSSAPYTCAWGTTSPGTHKTFARVMFNNGSFADSAPQDFVVGTTNPNLGFETPVLGGGQYQYEPGGASWRFTDTGIASNGSAFGSPNAPEGSQVAFVQFQGTMSQTLAGFVPGTNYTISYSAAQRPGNQQTWDVKVDNTVIQSGSGGGSSFAVRSANFTATAAAHTLSFAGTNLNGGDNTIFIDNISFNPPLAANPGPALVVNPSPATAADVVGSEVSFAAAFSTGLPTTYQWQKIINGQVSNVPGATTPTLTLANLQLADSGNYRLQATNAAGVSVSKMSTLTVSSVPAAVNDIVVRYAAQTGLGAEVTNFIPTWEVAPGSLIASKAPASVGDGNFNQSTNVLTNGSAGRFTFNFGNANASQVTCGNGGGAGQSVTYNLGTSSGGYDLSGIVVYGGWADDGRDQQAYTVSYSTAADPETFTQLAVVNHNPANPADIQSATRAILRSSNSGPLASDVAALKFDFTTPASENGYCGYTEIAVYGTPLEPAVIAQTTPATATDVVGGQVTFTASIVGASPLSYQWQKVVGGVPGNINGATASTLTLTNLQAGDAAGYQLKATNAQGSVTSSPATLTVTNVPAAVNNVITSMAAQTGLGGNTTFVPGWQLAADNSLIGGMAPSTSVGNFNLNSNNKPLASLTTLRPLAISQTTGGDNSTNYLSCGNGSGAGSSVIYTLPAGGNGHTLTKIVVHGGWSDAGRDQQAYTVSYSKVATPNTFVTLGSVNYNPANPAAVQSTTRATLTPANGVLATNVAAVKFDFTTPGSENGWLGYGQLAVYGTPTLSAPINLTATPGDAQASLTWAATPGATSYNVKRSTVSGGSYSTVGSVTTTGFVNTGLSNGTVYYYVVTALNGSEETAGSGQVSVTPVAAGYEGWVAGYPSLSGANRSPDADPDGDGMPNGIEFMSGTSPTSSSSAARPAATVDASGNLVLHFKRVDAAKTYTVTVESTPDFQGPWASVGVNPNAITGPPVTVVDNGTAADDVTVVLPSGGQRTKFARVRIAIPPAP